MSNGFGFTRPGQQPAPDPRLVGQQLQQQPQRAPEVEPFGDEAEFEAPARSQEAFFRREGGKLMGAGGPDSDGALSAAVGEALTRAGGGHQGNPNPHKRRESHIRHLQQLGISELEANLLGETL